MKGLTTTLTAIGFVIAANTVLIPIALAAAVYLLIAPPKKPGANKNPPSS